MSQFLHNYKDDDKAIAIPRVLYENSQAKNSGDAILERPR